MLYAEVLLVLFLSGAILVGAAFWIRLHLQQRRRMLKRLACLHRLTPEERAYLRPYVRDWTAIMPSPRNEIVAGLLAKGILDRPVGELPLPYRLQPWAREQLELHPHILEGINVIAENDFALATVCQNAI